MKSQISHDIKHRLKANDEFFTPVELVRALLPLVPVKTGETVVDPAFGKGAFFNEFPAAYPQAAQPFGNSTDFFSETTPQDWLITNPPYSKMDQWLEHSCKLAKKGFAYLLLQHSVTPRRLEMCEKAGFGVTKIHLSKVFEWYGISQFVIWERGANSVIGYDRKVWR